MIFNKLKWEKNSEISTRKETEEIIKEEFEEYDKNKYYVFIGTGILHNHIVNDIKCIIKIVKNGNPIVINEKSKVRSPYPNKNWYVLDRKFGRKLKEGYILKFDTIEELNSFQELLIEWKIVSNYSNGEKFVVCVNIEYELEFKKVGEDNVFNIKSWDYCKEDMLDEESYENKIKEYDKQFDENNYYTEEDGSYYLEEHKQKLHLKSDNSRIDRMS